LSSYRGLVCGDGAIVWNGIQVEDEIFGAWGENVVIGVTVWNLSGMPNMPRLE